MESSRLGGRTTTIRLAALGRLGLFDRLDTGRRSVGDRLDRGGDRAESPRPILDEEMLDRLALAQAEMGCLYRVDLRESDAISGPAVLEVGSLASSCPRIGASGMKRSARPCSRTSWRMWRVKISSKDCLLTSASFSISIYRPFTGWPRVCGWSKSWERTLGERDFRGAGSVT